jgi:hypothetical protein
MNYIYILLIVITYIVGVSGQSVQFTLTSSGILIQLPNTIAGSLISLEQAMIPPLSSTNVVDEVTPNIQYLDYSTPPTQCDTLQQQLTTYIDGMVTLAANVTNVQTIAQNVVDFYEHVRTINDDADNVKTITQFLKPALLELATATEEVPGLDAFTTALSGINSGINVLASGTVKVTKLFLKTGFVETAANITVKTCNDILEVLYLSDKGLTEIVLFVQAAKDVTRIVNITTCTCNTTTIITSSSPLPLSCGPLTVTPTYTNASIVSQAVGGTCNTGYLYVPVKNGRILPSVCYNCPLRTPNNIQCVTCPIGYIYYNGICNIVSPTPECDTKTTTFCPFGGSSGVQQSCQYVDGGMNALVRDAKNVLQPVVNEANAIATAIQPFTNQVTAAYNFFETVRADFLDKLEAFLNNPICVPIPDFSHVKFVPSCSGCKLASECSCSCPSCPCSGFTNFFSRNCRNCIFEGTKCALECIGGFFTNCLPCLGQCIGSTGNGIVGQLTTSELCATPQQVITAIGNAITDFTNALSLQPLIDDFNSLVDKAIQYILNAISTVFNIPLQINLPLDLIFSAFNTILPLPGVPQCLLEYSLPSPSTPPINVS